MATFVPRKGDFVELSFRPDHGHEQHGRRPALVVSNDLFQRATGLCVVCPITRTDRKHPFHVPIPAGLGVDGVVLTDQVRSVDARAREARRLGRAPDALLDEVLAILDAVLF
ncbi:MAG: type II toxin-antitoxin system PemK/MazF family toxin [Trueperaceae bacterium]|nr:MAG: type II toxin-antitoxin system PemK/MazF family toxin [Trueperaceae bacterium]